MKRIENFEYINIKYANNETLVAIGQWLGVFPSSRLMGSSDALTCVPLKVDEYLKYNPFINDIDKEDISIMISNVLGLTGLAADKEAELYLVDEKMRKFNYQALDSDNKFVFNLFGDDDNYRQISVSNEAVKKSFDVKNIRETIPHLELLDIVQTNMLNGNRYARLLRDNVATLRLRNKENTFTITITKPTDDYHTNGAFCFKREGDISNHLLNLDFPVNIDEEWPVIAELTGISERGRFISQYEYIRLEVTRETENNITDVIEYQNGDLTDYKSSSSTPAMSEEQINYLNKVKYCTKNNLDPAMARDLTDFEFVGEVLNIDSKNSKRKLFGRKK